MLATAALAACSDSQSPEVQAPETASAPTANAADLPAATNKLGTAELVRVSGSSASRFNITLRFQTRTSKSQRAAFEAAVARWERQITGEVPDDSDGIPPDFCGISGVDGFTGTIDDVLIDVLLTPIDGPGTPEDGNVLGAAGPCAVRTSDLLTVYGIMYFDTFDIGSMETEGILENVIVHEMGHVLGVGTLWDLHFQGFPKRNLLLREPTGQPVFTGALANQAYEALGGRPRVPVEGDYGPGTALGHWDEETFDNELMTGFIGTGSSPLSNVTAASMIDLGYVGKSTGEPYQLPTLGEAVMSATRVARRGFDLSKMEILIKPKAR
jgi:hypothetical protein